MKANSFNKMNSVNKWRHTVLVLGIVSMFCLVVTAGSAQLKNQKRVTGLQLGDAGSRVTIVSDSPMSDYEAFRRGDRFYVKIPVASFAGASPNLRGNGFEDVRVQTIGDSIVVSFRLQPGATARVDQRSNRLDVIFSAVGAGRNPGTTASNAYPTSRNRRAAFSSGFNSDASAGPVPPISAGSSPQSIRNSYRASTPARSGGSTATSLNVVPSRNNRSTRSDSRVVGGNQNAASKPTTRKAAPEAARSYPTLPNARGGTSTTSRPPSTSGGSGSTSTLAPTPTPWTSTSPGATASPTWNAPTGTTGPTVYPTPANPYAQRPESTPLPIASNTSDSAWDSRKKTVKAWARLNRNALIVAGLILLALLLGLGIWARSRRKRGALVMSDRKTSKAVQEKVTGNPVVEGEPVKESPIAPVATAATASRGTQGNTRVPQAPAFKKATAQEHREVAQEREVFEL